MKSKLTHLPLEAYKSRYTEYLADIEAEEFSKKFDYAPVIPLRHQAAVDISSGSVLDSINRPLWSFQQLSLLLELPSYSLGTIYFSDFYTPGLDSLAYSGKKFNASAFLWAQTFDQYDFTRKMSSWMRPWEVMAFDIYDHVFVASSLLKELIVTALSGVEDRVHVIGLPFSSKKINLTVDLKMVPEETFDCVYTSRWDSEKNPSIFLDLVLANPSLKFAVCTGSPDLRGTDVRAIHRARAMVNEGKLALFKGLSKPEYFAILTKCRVQFNCALQDWVSFTLLEALSLGCMPLYPNTRSFPEALNYFEPSLYAPDSVEDASYKLEWLLNHEFPNSIRQQILGTHDSTLETIGQYLV